MSLAVCVSLILALALPALAAAEDQAQRTGFSGKSLYTTFCATCHGTGGKGDGPFAKSLRRPPSDLTQLARQNQGAFPADRVAKVVDGRETGPAHGNRDMPIWGDAFSRTKEDSDPESVQLKIKAIVAFLDSLQERP